MSKRVQDLFNAVVESAPVSGAKDYVSTNAKVITERAASVAKPYQTLVKENVDTAKTFVNAKLKEVKSADSFSAVVEIIVGIIVSAIKMLMVAVRAVREYLYQKYQSRYIDARNRVEELVENVKTKAIDMPNTPAAKKMEAVSKRVLGDSRHDQAVEFIKSSVIPIVHKSYEKVSALKSLSGSSSAADLTTEGGSVSAASPREEPLKDRKKQSTGGSRRK